MVLSDTPSDVLRRQVGLVRRASVARRFGAARSLSLTVAALSRRTLRRRRPEATAAEIDRAFVELHYGAALARRLLGDS